MYIFIRREAKFETKRNKKKSLNYVKITFFISNFLLFVRNFMADFN